MAAWVLACSSSSGVTAREPAAKAASSVTRANMRFIIIG